MDVDIHRNTALKFLLKAVTRYAETTIEIEFVRSAALHAALQQQSALAELSGIECVRVLQEQDVSDSVKR